MFKLSFTRKDLIRAAWAFVAGGIGAYVVAQQANQTGDWKVLLGAVVTAGLVSVKNLILADGSTAKG